MAMSEDWCIASIGRVEGAAHELHEALGRAMDGLCEAGSRRLAGGLAPLTSSMVWWLAGGREARLAPTVALREFEATATDYRASMIRALVDQEHLTFTEVGELTGASRQMVARLYRRAGGGGPATEGKVED
jgi:hypothetical protein